MPSCRDFLFLLGFCLALLQPGGLRAEEGEQLLLAAIDAAKAGRIEKAVSLYGEIISLERLSVDVKAAAFNNRGAIYDDLGRFEAALKDFSAALRLSPTSSEIYNNRGITFAKTGNFDRALLDFDRALFLSPDDPEIYSNRGVAYGKIGHPDKALRDFNRALKLQPQDALTLFNRALLYLEGGEEVRARADLEKAFALSPENKAIANKIDELGWSTVSPEP